MIGKPTIGMVQRTEFVVADHQAIEFADEELPAVLSTPALIASLERTARTALLPFLEEGESSLGIEIELAHLAPTPLGAPVTCQTRVVRVEGSRVSFQIEARDEKEIVAKGFHVRRIIRKSRFAQRVAQKRV